MNQATDVKTVLHVGCGPDIPGALHAEFRSAEWKEIRLDVDAAVEPDVVASMTEMPQIGDESIDAVWSSHNLEHLYAHEVPLALAEFHRVLKPGGFVLLIVPDLQQVARRVAEGKLEETLFVSPAGPITAIDMIYGFRPRLAEGHVHMAHKTGFTPQSLADKLTEAGFGELSFKADTAALALWAWAQK